MSWILAGVTLTAGSMLYKGGAAEGWWGDTQDRVQGVKDAAGDVFREQKLLAGRAKGVAVDKAVTSRTFSMNKLGFGARKSVTDLDAEENKLIAGANMGGSMYTSRTDKQKKTVFNTLESSQDYVKDTYDQSVKAAAIAEETSIAQAQKSYQDTITTASDRPDSFWEGFFT